jgi:Tfp pilus assembly PilM family ATPase
MQLSKLKLKFKEIKFKKPVVVVEIGNDWLKIVENNPTSGDRCISKIYLVKLARIKESVVEAISKIFKDLKLNKQSVITYIPRHLVTVRILEFPSTNAKEISDMVNLQIGKQTPYSKEEIISSHRIIDAEREGYTKVMLVIARRNLVSERVEVLRKAGIEVDKVAVSSEGVYNWFSIAYREELNLGPDAFILADIDSNYSDFVIIRKGKFVFSRNILIGANHLLEEPEKWQDKFIEELRYSIELYHSEERDLKVVKIFLSGTARYISDLDRTLSTRLDIPAQNTDPVKNIRIGKEAGDLLGGEGFRSVSVSGLFGASIKHKELELDLTPSEVRIQKLMEEKRKHLTVMGILFSSIVMMASLLLLTNIYNKNSYLAQLKQKISRIESQANEVERMRMQISLVEKRLDAKGASINILNEIYKLTPREIYFTNINIEEKKQAILRGRAFAMSNVFEFVTTLENSPYFEGVKTTYTTTKKEKDAEYAEFEIMCNYEGTDYR